MNSEQYKQQVLKTESPHFNTHDKSFERILHGAIGVCTEAGELMDIIKKHLFYDQDLDTFHLQEEIGDLFWYIALICTELELSFETIMDVNIKKLRKRYPEQFTTEAEQNRDYNAEKEAVLEKAEGWSPHKCYGDFDEENKKCQICYDKRICQQVRKEKIRDKKRYKNETNN